MDLDQLNWIPDETHGSAVWIAIRVNRNDIVRYIHSVNPALLLSVTMSNQSALHVKISHFGSCTNAIGSFEEVRSLSPPEAVIFTDEDGNNLLHAYCERFELSGGTDLDLENLKYLLRLVPDDLLVTMNGLGQVPYDLIISATTEEFPPDHIRTRARRLLLQAASSWGLYPEILQQMNYEDRKLALFAFHGTRVAVRVCCGACTVCMYLLSVCTSCMYVCMYVCIYMTSVSIHQIIGT